MLKQNVLHSLINPRIFARNLKTSFTDPKVHKRIDNTLIKKLLSYFQ